MRRGPLFMAFQAGAAHYGSRMRLIGFSLMVATAAATPLPSQAAQAQAPAQAEAQTSSAWDPAAPYITKGQDDAGYRSWYLSAPAHAVQVKAFNDYLVSAEVGGVLPTWQLLRTATAWQECGGQPFEVPPSEEWPHLVETLRYVRDYVIPTVGPVEAVSVYRNPQLNKCAGGAPASAHMLDSAIDMVPLRPTTRETMMRSLCAVHTEHGAAYKAGLGFYAFLRFHVDSTKFRRWNMDPAVAADCAPIIHPEDVASVGQPIPAAAAPQNSTGAVATFGQQGSVAPAASTAPLPAAPAVSKTTVPPAVEPAHAQSSSTGQPHR